MKKLGNNRAFNSAELIHAFYLLKTDSSNLDKFGTIHRKKKLLFKYLPFLPQQKKYIFSTACKTLFVKRYNLRYFFLFFSRPEYALASTILT